MARFAAKFANYTHGVRTGRWMVLSDGQRQENTKHLQAKFRRGVLSEEEENVAIAGLNHTGRPIDQDTSEHVSPRSRISGFDSVEAQEFNGWTDEERELVENTLRTSPFNGIEFLELDSVAAKKPWPSYDNTPADLIADYVQMTGVPLEQVLQYERENANRPDVIETLLGAEDEDDSPVVITA